MGLMINIFGRTIIGPASIATLFDVVPKNWVPIVYSGIVKCLKVLPI